MTQESNNMAHPTDEKLEAVLKSADALIHHLRHTSVVDNRDRQTIADMVATLRALSARVADLEARILAALEPAPDHSDWNAVPDQGESAPYQAGRRVAKAMEERKKG